MASNQEQILFSLNAQIYALDKTQKWTPLTTSIVPVQFLKNKETGVVRILGIDNNVIIVNSQINAGMQYRRPSDTFVQWFDSQHILYGLNLTSATDAEGFEREFEAASGKKGKSKENQSNNNSNALLAAAPANGDQQSKNNSLNSKQSLTDTAAPQIQQQKDDVNTTNTAKSSIAQKLVVKEASVDSIAESMSRLNSSTPESKTVTQLRQKVKDLELQVLTLEGEKSGLSEQLQSSAKIISSLKSHIATLEEDLDKYKSQSTQNSANINVWKQQLQHYQELNDDLTLKMSEFEQIYERMGELLTKENKN